MMRKAFLEKIFDAANMQRWNDKIRPVELRELDKQAHKMTIAYVLGKYEEENGSEGFDWIEIIEGGIFEFLQRLVVTDLKPQIFHKIRKDKDKYKWLNEWVYNKIESKISCLGNDFCKKFRNYLLSPTVNLNRRILSAAHFYATKWEFDIMERANPNGYEISEIKKNVQKEQEKYYDLNGIQQLALWNNLRNFIDFCGQLRFQIRWSHLHRVPRTSVLGHVLIVAMLCYLFSKQINACKRRCINNYFTGLFHDLPEALTRDIIDPVKKAVEGLEDLINEYEEGEMKTKIYVLLPEKWRLEMEMFTKNEYQSIITVNDKIQSKTSDEITTSFNEDKYNPRDGEIVKAADDLAAFMEAFLSIKNGIKNQELQGAKDSLNKRYQGVIISGIKFAEIYADFD
ncbi:MAG: HD domain-containing protein [Candidatus Zixiibacteriota bacterium]